MPNYFDYISESAERYDEPDFVEESVNDAFNDTIADMDLYCFQEGLATVAAIIGGAAIIGLLIALIRKIISALSSTSGSAKKAFKEAKKAGVETIVAKPGAKTHDNGGSASSATDSTGSTSTETETGSSQKSLKDGFAFGTGSDKTVIQSNYIIEIVDWKSAAWRKAYTQIKAFFNKAIDFFQKYSETVVGNNQWPNSLREKAKELMSPEILSGVPSTLDSLKLRKEEWRITDLEERFVTLEKEIIPELKGYESDLRDIELSVKSAQGDRPVFEGHGETKFRANTVKISKFNTMLENNLNVTCKDIRDSVRMNLHRGPNTYFKSGPHKHSGY